MTGKTRISKFATTTLIPAQMDVEQDSKYAIHEAAREGRTNVVESLLNVIARYKSASNSKLDLSMLTASQANASLATRRDDDERLPLHWAVANHHNPVVELLVSRKDFDPDVQDGSGWTPLMIASSLREGDELVDVLLRKEADVNIKNYNGQTALHFCASKNNLEVARKLLSQNASARVRDKRGQLALHRAAAIGSVPMVTLLLDNKSPLNASDMSGYTALHHAISEGHGDTALLLLRAGAESDRKDIDGHLAIELAPDTKIRNFLLQSAHREGINLG